jgi:hypothetical protein
MNAGQLYNNSHARIVSRVAKVGNQCKIAVLSTFQELLEHRAWQSDWIAILGCTRTCADKAAPKLRYGGANG